jgi:hypothetical protein
MFTLNVVAAQANSAMTWLWRGSYFGGDGFECVAVLPDEVSEGQRGAAAGRFQGGGA